jgi:hypothetical protein
MNMPISDGNSTPSHGKIERLVLDAYLASTRDRAFRAFVRSQIACDGAEAPRATKLKSGGDSRRRA